MNDEKEKKLEAVLGQILVRLRMAIDDDSDQWLEHRDRLELLLEKHAAVLGEIQ